MLKYRLVEGPKKSIMTSWDTCDQISEATTAFRKASERVRAIFRNLRKGKRKKEGRGGWGKEGKKAGRGVGKDKKKSAEGGVGWVGDDVIKKIKNEKIKK